MCKRHRPKFQAGDILQFWRYHPEVAQYRPEVVIEYHFLVLKIKYISISCGQYRWRYLLKELKTGNLFEYICRNVDKSGHYRRVA